MILCTGPADPAKIKYEAESPDEAALVAAGKAFGFFFYKRTNTTVFVRESEGGQVQDREYEILNILEFDSTRKRMSVICRTPEGKLKLYCKVMVQSAMCPVICPTKLHMLAHDHSIAPKCAYSVKWTCHAPFQVRSLICLAPKQAA